MKALVYRRYGMPIEVVRLEDSQVPAPARGQVLVRVRYASVNPIDWKLMGGHLRLFTKQRLPRGVGTEFAGEIVEAGESKGTRIGDTVVGFLDPFKDPTNAMAEYVLAPAGNVCTIPQGIGMDAASALPVAGIAGLQMCRLGQISAGQHVLVNGAAGGVGTMAAQIAHHLGAKVCATASSSNQEHLSTLRVDTSIDCSNVPVSGWPAPFDAILDCVGNLSPSALRVLLRKGGHYVSAVPSFPGFVFENVLNRLRDTKYKTLFLAPGLDDLRTLLKMVADGQLQVHVAREFPLERAAEALELSRMGHARGKTVIRVA